MYLLVLFNLPVWFLYGNYTTSEYPNVRLADIVFFNDIKEVTTFNVTLANEHHYENNVLLAHYIKSNYTKECYEHWKMDVNRRYSLWQCANLIHYPINSYSHLHQVSLKDKLDIYIRCLNLLYEELGEDYYLGILPNPLPNYKVK